MTSTTPPATTSGTQTTKINGKWRRKMMIFAVILVGLGVYGLFDAMYAYPRRGYKAAQRLEYEYLKYLNDAGRLSNTAASIDDPTARLERATQSPSGEDRLVGPWLTQLKYVNRLSASNTTIPRRDYFNDGVSKGGAIESASTRLEALKAAPHAEALESYDIPVQWLICATGFVWGGYIVVLMLRVGRKSYAWDPVAKRLTLPDGNSFTPADLLEIDKRKWHKFFVNLTIKPQHQNLGGKTIELDLLRFVPLEDWVLEMERIAFPDDEKAQTKPGADDGGAPKPE
jgi:hypothetical protein